MVESCPHSLYFFRGDIEQFYLDEAINTFKDWHIMPLGRPVINPPEQKRTVIDIPGTNGIIDLSNSLTKYPVFNNRTGSIRFAVDYDKTDWITAYTKIMKFLQGNPVKMFMEDDPNYYYEGSFWVDEWDSRNDGTWSEISISYDVKPYRRYKTSSTDDWLWDPFNFETDVIQDTAFTEIEITASDPDWDTFDVSGLIDMMPVIPAFDVVTNNNEAMEMEYLVTDLYGSVWKSKSLEIGPNKVYYDVVLCENTPESVVQLRFRNPGLVTVHFRSGRL